MMIEGRRFAAFVRESSKARDEEKLWNIWLHKDFSGRSFEDFRRSLRTSRVAALKPTKRQLGATVKDSLEILSRFRPDSQ